MREEQKLLFVADELSLMKTYNLAMVGNRAITPSALAIAGISVIGAAFGPTVLTVATSAGASANFFAKLKNSIPTVDKDNILSAIQQSLGLGVSLGHMTLDESRTISLGMGQLARNNSFYISHPIKPDIYVPLQDYNNLLAKEKNNVFMELAGALGAKSIYLEDASFYNTKGQIDTDISVLKPVAIDIGIKAKFEENGSIKKEVYSSFDKPKREPIVPPHLQKWVDIDSDLKLMATHRLDYGLRSHQIILKFEDKLEGAADAAAKITGTNKGFGFKSSASKHVSSTWVFKVEYHSIDDE